MTELCLYQTIHLFQGRARLLVEHIAVLDAASRELFGRPYTPDPRRLEARIAALAQAERYPHGVAGFVRLELLPNGDERILPAGVSLYAGYALRSLRPDAVCVACENPLGDLPTTAREATALLARLRAERSGAAVAVRCDNEGICLTADDAPLFAVTNKRLFTSPGTPGVERALAIRAIRAAGLYLSEEPIRREELRRIDELFYVDHRGVTALAHCDGHPFMPLIAERVAEALEGLFPKI